MPVDTLASNIFISLEGLSCLYRSIGEGRYSVTRRWPVLISAVTAIPGVRSTIRPSTSNCVRSMEAARLGTLYVRGSDADPHNAVRVLAKIPRLHQRNDLVTADGRFASVQEGNFDDARKWMKCPHLMPKRLGGGSMPRTFRKARASRRPIPPARRKAQAPSPSKLSSGGRTRCAVR
jgi:hypothetical protein